MNGLNFVQVLSILVEMRLIIKVITILQFKSEISVGFQRTVVTYQMYRLPLLEVLIPLTTTFMATKEQMFQLLKQLLTMRRTGCYTIC